MIRPLRHVVSVSLAVAALTASALDRPARAEAQTVAPEEPPPAVAAAAPLITATGTCPGRDVTSSAVAALIPRGSVDSLPRLAAVEVFDLGDSYRVKVVAEGVLRERVFRDVNRDCQQRARFAAVFIVLTLLPPELVIDVQPPPAPPAPPPPPPPVPVAPPPPAAAARPPSPRPFRLEVGAVLDLAPAIFDAPQIVSFGAEVRLARRFGPLAAVIGAGVEPRASFAAGGLSGRVERIPFDLGVRLQRPLGPWEVGGELGVAAAIFHAEGLNTLMPQQGTRLDLGARAGLYLRFGRSATRAAPFVGVHGVVFPRPYEIATTPQGTLGSMPALWLGATLGLAASL